MNIHTLSNGATVLVMSPSHGFKFSDGTSADPQATAICDRLTLKRETQWVRTIKGMALNSMRMLLSDEQLDFLAEMTKEADLVLVPFPVLASLREQGVRDRFPNVVAFNATAETQRSAPADKVVDVNNWSY